MAPTSDIYVESFDKLSPADKAKVTAATQAAIIAMSQSGQADAARDKVGRAAVSHLSSMQQNIAFVFAKRTLAGQALPCLGEPEKIPAPPAPTPSPAPPPVPAAPAVLKPVTPAKIPKPRVPPPMEKTVRTIAIIMAQGADIRQPPNAEAIKKALKRHPETQREMIQAQATEALKGARDLAQEKGIMIQQAVRTWSSASHRKAVERQDRARE